MAPLKIAGVTPGASMTDVIDQLGEPAEKEESDGFIIHRFVYSEVVVGFDEVGTVALIESKSRSACILTEICLGARIDSILSEISRHGYIHEVVGEKLIINGDGCWGEVHVLKGVADEVGVRCSP